MAGRTSRGGFEDSSSHAEDAFPRTLSRGRAFVYVVACRDDSLFKIGFSRDPLERWRTLHPRFFDFFSLDDGVLVRVERVAQARHLERMLIDAFADYGALAPPTTKPSAGGHTEWFRGVLAEAVELARETALRNAWEWQRPADWLRASLLERRDRLFSWTSAAFDALEFERHNEGIESAQAGARHERALLDTLDAFDAIGLDIDAYLPEQVRRWYRESTDDRRVVGGFTADRDTGC